MNKQTLNEEFNQIPCSLKATQEWFASIITHELDEDDTIYPYTTEGYLVAEEACRYIIPSHTSRPPHKRMQIYNQQYWWRLLNTLHTIFPMVTRLFGSHAFNEQIGIPFLLKYPPNHWSISMIGERLSKWVMESYDEPDQSLVFNASSLDWAFTSSFITSQYPPLDLPSLINDNPDRLLSYTFYLQPHINLFKWDYDLLTFRQKLLEENSDYWVEHRFPNLAKSKTYCFVLYRHASNNISWKEIGQGEFLFLERFKEGTTIHAACEYIEKQELSIYEEMASNLEKWLQEWTQSKWLTLTPPNEI